MSKLWNNLFTSLRSLMQRTPIMSRMVPKPNKAVSPKDVAEKCQEDMPATELKLKGPLGEITVIDIDASKFFKDQTFAENFDSPFLSDDIKYGPGSALNEPCKGEIREHRELNSLLQIFGNEAVKNEKVGEMALKKDDTKDGRKEGIRKK